MSIDDTTIPTVTRWRAALHDLVDDVLDHLLHTAEAERRLDPRAGGAEARADGARDGGRGGWDEPPGDPPGVAGLPGLSDALEAGLAAEIERGTASRGCDGTLWCTRRWAEQVLDRPDDVLEAYRRGGRSCDCDVLHGALGRPGPRPRCPRRRGGP